MSRKRSPKCEFGGCDNPAVHRGACAGHASRLQRRHTIRTKDGDGGRKHKAPLNGFMREFRS